MRGSPAEIGEAPRGTRRDVPGGTDDHRGPEGREFESRRARQHPSSVGPHRASGGALIVPLEWLPVTVAIALPYPGARTPAPGLGLPPCRPNVVLSSLAWALASDS